ncbi:hypothetical protein OG946_01365 [Streptomyces sp. NBC_01808]|uniref:hypothetical protein n=1 Tax=Streptomyces sp. NBC_01808 TaxID=2975947 RepID=UPI002DDC794B|nr:hypothetical protein [Streptomyces sp. NBC_01808]WSA36135.1 hypothetical protein OG946_01365 [Streptomyces sp. NBC_01808]
MWFKAFGITAEHHGGIDAAAGHPSPAPVGVNRHARDRVRRQAKQEEQHALSG